MGRFGVGERWGGPMGRKGDSGPARACSTRTKETPAWFRPTGRGLGDRPFDWGTAYIQGGTANK